MVDKHDCWATGTSGNSKYLLTAGNVSTRKFDQVVVPVIGKHADVMPDLILNGWEQYGHVEALYYIVWRIY